MKKIPLLILCMTSAFALNAQTTFQKSYGGSDDDSMYGLTKTHDGGYVMAGQTESFGGTPFDIYIIKTNANGTVLWSKVYRGNASDYATYIQETADHGFLVSGGTTSYGAGSDDAFLLKTDSVGGVQWSKVYGGAMEDIFFSTAQTFDGGYIAAGHTFSFGAGSVDALVVRTDASGDTLWTRIIGGTGWDQASSIIQTSDSNFVLCGRTGSFTTGYLKIFLAKLDASGDTLWTLQYGGNGQEESQSVKETLDGDYIVVGSTNSFSSTNYNAYLNRFNTNGNLLWSKIYGGPKVDAFYEIVNMADSGFAFTGFTESFGIGHRGSDSANVMLIRTDANGDTLWTRTYGGTKMDEVFGLVKTDDEGLVILAYSSSFGTDSLDAYLIKTDASGNSNCNETPCAPFVFAPATIVSATSPQITSGVSVALAPFTEINPPTHENVLCFILGTNNVESSSDGFTLFPNPAANQLTIDNGQLTISSIDVFDLVGRKIIHRSLREENKFGSRCERTSFRNLFCENKRCEE